ncbi:MAG: hypothetical protein FWF55_09845 [Treponema sp.]|nr:hypothetical protein [Treponema sp.]
MEESPLVRLDLRAPLEYEEAPGLAPFSGLPADDAAPELLFCFELDREQAGRIDPEADRFLGELVFSGKGNGTQGKVQLPAGLYVFAQERRTEGSQTLNREECVNMAIEQQKDGMWERLHLGTRLYIRCLFEDGSPVVQFFRPYSKEEGGSM